MRRYGALFLLISLMVTLVGCGNGVANTQGTVIVATPTISPAGGSFTSPQSVTLADATTGASIHYTTDGTVPTASSTTYTSAITVSASLQLRVIATQAGAANSAEAGAGFIITLPQASAPVITPLTGNYTAPQTVTITDATPGATIYYTTDGTTPATTSNRYSGSFQITTTATVRAIAVATGYSSSAITTATLTLASAPSALTLTGSVLVSKAAISGASVQLLAAGTTGYGSAATTESVSTAVTDSRGGFQLSYRCAAATDQVYLVSRRGTPAGRTLGSITNLVLVTALGNCGGLEASAIVNEVTTVAAGYALAQFADGTGVYEAASHIGATATNTSGMANAFLTANVLADPALGQAGGPVKSSSSVVPASTLNTLAAIVATCGAVSGSDPCSALLQAAATTDAVSPVDSFMAIVNVARHAGSNINALYALASNGAYAPRLSASPKDWSLGIAHSGGGLGKPTALAVDSVGNVWVANYSPAAVSKFSPQGAPLSPSAGYVGGGLYELLGLTIDPTGNVWVTSSESAGSVNSGLGAVQKFSSAGVLLSGSTGYGSGTVNFPEAAAADALGNIWLANYGNSTAAELTSTGSALTPAGGLGVGTGKFFFPVAVAVDASSNAWFANQSGDNATMVSAARAVGTPVSCCNAPSGVALDAKGNIWLANYYGSSVSEIRPNGTVVSSGYTGGGINQPQGIAIDGAGNVWVANYRGNNLSAFQGENSSQPGTPLFGTDGFGNGGGLSLPTRLAIDASGNLWVASNGNNALIEYVGSASPVRTPLLGLPVRP